MPLICLTGCAAPKFPADFIYEIDLKTRTCGMYQIVDHKNIRIEYVRDVDPGLCPTVFGFSSSEMPGVLDWVRDRIKELSSAN